MSGVHRLRAAVVGLAGWRRLVLATVLGATGTLALPPLHGVPALVVAFAGLLWLIDGSRGYRSAAVIGWCFGVGWFAAGLHWIAYAFLVDAERFGALAIPAVLGLAMGLGLFIAMAAALARLVPAGTPRALVLAVAWTAMEALRGHLLTGFPWNLLATVWAPFDAMAQGAAVFGAYGLGLLTAIVALLPATLARKPILACIALLAVAWIGGTARLADADKTMVEGVRLRLVQAGIDQRDKWKDALRAGHLARHIEMSRSPATSAATPVPTHVFWPEAAVAFFIDEQPDVRAAIATAVPAGGVVVTGTIRRAYDEADAMKVWNSIQAIDGTGAVVATYDKVHLVPFGEYMPLRGILPLDKLTQGSVDFSPGAGRRAIHLPGLPPAVPLVCYEAIFPGDIVPAGPRPAWLLNLTNDAWFGEGAGPYQHFAAARLRSIEEGLPLVRAAGSGISAVVDPYGRVIARLDLGVVGVLDSPLPKPLSSVPVYGRLRDTIAALAAVAVLLIAWIASRRAQRP